MKIWLKKLKNWTLLSWLKIKNVENKFSEYKLIDSEMASISASSYKVHKIELIR